LYFGSVKSNPAV